MKKPLQCLSLLSFILFSLNLAAQTAPQIPEEVQACAKKMQEQKGEMWSSDERLEMQEERLGILEKNAASPRKALIATAAFDRKLCEKASPELKKAGCSKEICSQIEGFAVQMYEKLPPNTLPYTYKMIVDAQKKALNDLKAD